MGSNNDSEDTFLSQNKFLEKEEAFRKMNEELEKKTSVLLEKMDKFWKTRSAQYGDGDSASEFGTEDGLSLCSERTYSGRSSVINEDFYDYGGAGDTEALYGFVNKQSKSRPFPRPSTAAPAFNTTSLMTEDDEITNTSPRMKRQKSRLQRATESVIKSLQAKLVNHEERLTDIHLQYRQKIQENTIQETKIKALEEERERLLRTISNQHGVVEKHAKHAEVSKSSLSQSSQAVSTLKREIDDLRKDKKFSNSSCQSLQARLHRVTEENEKVKSMNKSLTLQLREFQSDFKLKLDEKQQKIVELEKQRNVLNSTVGKQSQVIKQLREQKTRSRAHSQQCLSGRKSYGHC